MKASFFSFGIFLFLIKISAASETADEADEATGSEMVDTGNGEESTDPFNANLISADQPLINENEGLNSQEVKIDSNKLGEEVETEVPGADVSALIKEENIDLEKSIQSNFSGKSNAPYWTEVMIGNKKQSVLIHVKTVTIIESVSSSDSKDNKSSTDDKRSKSTSTENGRRGDKSTSTENGRRGDKSTSTENGRRGDKSTSTENGRRGDKSTSTENGRRGDKSTSTENGRRGDKSTSTENGRRGDKSTSTENGRRGDKSTSTENGRRGDKSTSTENGRRGDKSTSAQNNPTTTAKDTSPYIKIRMPGSRGSEAPTPTVKFGSSQSTVDMETSKRRNHASRRSESQTISSKSIASSTAKNSTVSTVNKESKTKSSSAPTSSKTASSDDDASIGSIFNILKNMPSGGKENESLYVEGTFKFPKKPELKRKVLKLNGYISEN
ncbi:hypothetical protein GINT2_000966 [Glugoides intestinalis]